MFVVNDTLDAIFLGCFFFGLIFSGLSLFLGIADIGFGHLTGGHDGHGIHFGHHHGSDGLATDSGPSPISVGTILGFLTWFGGVAYLARNGLNIYGGVSLVLGIAAGLAGGYVIFWVLRKVQAQQAGIMHAADDYLPGTIAKVTSSIRAGGTGEIIFEHQGIRKASAARSQSGRAIPRGTEVVILRHASGIAEVEPWSSLIDDGFDDLDRIGEGRKLDLPPPEGEHLSSPDGISRAQGA
jgi:hypothetical protein